MEFINSSVSCDYLNDRNNLTKSDFEWQKQNPADLANQLVKTCPNICDLVYGDGNPDISGIGVFSSIIIQDILLTILQPMLAIIFLLMPTKLLVSSSKTRNTVLRLKRISGVIQGTSHFLSFSTLLASRIGSRQSSPQFELAYLLSLVQYITMLNVSGIGSFVSFFMRDVAQDLELVRCLDCFNFLCNLINWIFSLFNTDYTLAQYQREPMSRELMTACEASHRYPHFWTLSKGSKWHFVPLISPILSYCGVVWGSMILKRTFNARIFEQIQQFFSNATLWTSFGVFLNILYISGNMLCGVALYGRRLTMQEANRKATLDNEWGFGQITAMLIWAPPFLWMMRKALCSLPWAKMLLISLSYAYKRSGRSKGSLERFSNLHVNIVEAFRTIGQLLDVVDPFHEQGVFSKRILSLNQHDGEECAAVSNAGNSEEIDCIPRSSFATVRSTPGTPSDSDDYARSDAHISTEHVNSTGEGRGY